MTDDDLLAVADELYGLPLGEFTSARDEQARAHRGTDLAVRIKGLRKPTTAAWIVDLLVRREPDQVDQLLSVGAALREAQEAMSSGELRELTKQRRQVTAAIAQQARRHAAAAGLPVTRAIADQVEATLTAAMVDAECGRALRSGLLVKPLATTGVSAVAEADVAAAVAVPAALGFAATARAPQPSARPDLHVVPDPDAAEKKLRLARERLEEAERAHAQAAAELEEADGDVSRLNARELQLQSEAEELRRALAAIEDELEEVDEELAEAQVIRDEVAASARTAAAERDAAAAAVDRLS